VACGSWHSLAATEEGDLFAWGVALMSRCGFDTIGMPIDDLCPYQPTPLAVVAMPKVLLQDATSVTLRGPDSVCSDLKGLLNDESYADVIFVVDGEELRAHVAILAARCEYFRDMFRSGMAESRIDVAKQGYMGSEANGLVTRRVVVADCGPAAFKQLLLWLYSGTVEACLPTEELASLLRLSDLYRMPALRQECERLLTTHIDLESTLALLEVAITAGAGDLEVACLNFAVDNVAAIRRHISYEDCNNAEVMRRLATAWASDLERTRCSPLPVRLPSASPPVTRLSGLRP